MPSIEDIVRDMRNNPANIRFHDLEKVCRHYFGDRYGRGSHHKYKTPWQGEPRVNIQEGKGGKAKPYQVKQVVTAIDMLESEEAEGQEGGQNGTL